MLVAVYECIASYEPMAPTNCDTSSEEVYQRKSSIKLGNGQHKPNTTSQLKDRLKELQSERSELGWYICNYVMYIMYMSCNIIYC